MAKDKASKDKKEKKSKKSTADSGAAGAAKSAKKAARQDADAVAQQHSAVDIDEEATADLKKRVKKKLKKTLGRKPTSDEVDALFQKKLKKLATATATESAPEPKVQVEVEAASTSDKKSKKEKKSKKVEIESSDSDAAEAPTKPKKKSKESKSKRKRASDDVEEEEDDTASNRLDWTAARFQGSGGTQRKDKFLRLMGGMKGSGNAAGSGASNTLLPPGGVIASLMSAKATPAKSIFSVAPKKKAGGPAKLVDVNSGTQKNRGLMDQCDRAQQLLRSRQKNGGKLGFSI
eukprot:m.307479 g.307479  ORF g.307479 m.307479 type:complete len:290 (+) comp27387_c0_seq1:294-1163(+)